jgi:hypothetical protein
MAPPGSQAPLSLVCWHAIIHFGDFDLDRGAGELIHAGPADTCRN